MHGTDQRALNLFTYEAVNCLINFEFLRYLGS